MTINTYHQALATLPYHFIALIGRTRGLGIDTNLTKAALIDKVAAALSQPAAIQQAAAALSPAAAAALTDLRAAGGRLPPRFLLKPYGPLRSPRDLIGRHRRGAELSPLEQLHLAGLLLVDAGSGDLYRPPAIEPHLPPLPLHPSPPQPQSAGPLPPVDLLCHDLTLLLGLLQRQPIPLQHGRWLPPRFLKRWGRRCAVPPAHPAARSELQSNRRRFIHYLAEAMGLLNGEPSAVSGQRSAISGQPSAISGQRSAVSGQPSAVSGQRSAISGQPSAISGQPSAISGQPSATQSPHLPISQSPLSSSQSPISNPQSPITNHPTPTPAAWLWLNASRAERLQRLWHSWQRPHPALWRRYRWPGATWLDRPDPLLAAIHTALLDLDPADPARFAAALVQRQPHLRDLLPANQLDPLATLIETITRLLSGPLLWLGLLQNEELKIKNEEKGVETGDWRLTILNYQLSIINSQSPPRGRPG